MTQIQDRLPNHSVGSTFRLTFSQPGVYEFQCKLHPVVHGEVIVSDTPGNPLDDPDPVPKLNVHADAPHPHPGVPGAPAASPWRGRRSASPSTTLR